MTTIEVRNQAELDAAIKQHGNNPGAVIRVVAGEVTLHAAISARVWASGSATVEAYGSATVEAYGSATVRAYGSATVEASTHVAVHRHTTRATITGGVVIDHTTVDHTDPRVWAGYVGATVTGDTVTLYKAVDKDHYAGHQYRLTRYPIGESVTAPDWRDDHNCGYGLHASPHPHQALDYHQALSYHADAARMLTVECDLGDLRPIPGGTPKAKARTFRVTGEVRLDGTPL